MAEDQEPGDSLLNPVEEQAPEKEDLTQAVAEQIKAEPKLGLVKKEKPKQTAAKKKKPVDTDTVFSNFQKICTLLPSSKALLVKTRPERDVLFLYYDDNSRYVLEDAEMVLRAQGFSVTGKNLYNPSDKNSAVHLLQDLQRHRKVLVYNEEIADHLQGFLNGTGREVILFGKPSKKYSRTTLNVYDLKEMVK